MASGSESKKQNINQGAAAGGGAVYGLGLVGALVYYLQHAGSFWLVLLAFVKAIIWPALLVYNLLGLLHM